MNSKLSLLWGFIIFLSAGSLFYFSNNSGISVFYVFISMFCGIFLIVFRKDIPPFSPIFMLVSSIFINIGFSALYLFTGQTSFNEELLKNISIVYLIYFFSLIIPVFFANQMFIPSKENLQSQKTNLFNINFNPKNISIYLLLSNLLLIFSVAILLKITGFHYLEALKSPLSFRLAASAGYLSYIRKFVIFLFMLNTFLLSKYNFSENTYKQDNSLKLKAFTFLHVVLLLLFSVISGSRSIILLPIISSIAIFTFYNRLNVKTIFSITIIFLLTFLLISFYADYRSNAKNINFSVKPEFIYKNLTKISSLNQTLKRADNFKNSLYFFEYIERENNTILYFKDFHLPEQIKDHFLQPFSRNFIPDKGYYFSTLMTGKVFGTEINEAKATYNFGGISNAFWNLGITGIVLEGLFLGIAVVWLHRKFLKFINYDSFFMFFMTTFFFIPNSIIVDGFWNTMDGCGYFLNLLVVFVVVGILSFSPNQYQLMEETNPVSKQA